MESVRACLTGCVLNDINGYPLQLLALELLKILLENSGPVFRHSERFISAIKQYLCLSLLKNVTSSVTQAQALTCSIFFTLLIKFRQSLKAEIGVFFPMILLRAVEPAVQGATPNTGSRALMTRLDRLFRAPRVSICILG